MSTNNQQPEATGAEAPQRQYAVWAGFALLALLAVLSGYVFGTTFGDDEAVALETTTTTSPSTTVVESIEESVEPGGQDEQDPAAQDDTAVEDAESPTTATRAG